MSREAVVVLAGDVEFHTARSEGLQTRCLQSESLMDDERG